MLSCTYGKANLNIETEKSRHTFSASDRLLCLNINIFTVSAIKYLKDFNPKLDYAELLS